MRLVCATIAQCLSKLKNRPGATSNACVTAQSLKCGVETHGLLLCGNCINSSLGLSSSTLLKGG